MRKVFILSLLLIVFLFALVGCSTKTEETKSGEKQEILEIATNTFVGYLKYYVPEDFTYRADLRGLAYSEDLKKVHIKGDYESDPDNVISVVAYVSNEGKGAKQYTDEINEKLSDEDVKYEIKPNGKIIEIYARENYEINGKVNYAYIADKYEEIYVVNIVGPKEKAEEISQLANEIYSSLHFNT